MIKMLKKYRVRDYDFKLIIMLIAITVVGILVIGSAAVSYTHLTLPTT